MKIVKHPLVLLALKTIGASILAISTVSLLMIFIGTLSFTTIRVLEELFALDFKGGAEVMLGGFFILIILLMAYVLFLIPINIILGIICGIIISTCLFLDFTADKINIKRLSFVSGLTIALLGNVNFLIMTFVTDTSSRKYSWDYISSMYFTFTPSVLKDWGFYWGIIMLILMISLGFYSGTQIGKIFSKDLLFKGNAS